MDLRLSSFFFADRLEVYLLQSRCVKARARRVDYHAAFRPSFRKPCMAVWSLWPLSLDALDAVAWTKKIKGRPWRLAFQYLRALETQRVEKDVVLCNTAITCCEEEAQWQSALQLLSRFEGIRCSVVSIGAVISGLERAARWRRASEALARLYEAGIRANAAWRSNPGRA